VGLPDDRRGERLTNEIQGENTMTTPTNLERIDYGSPDGSILKGSHQNIIQGVGATRQLLAKESGSRCIFDRTAGNNYILPTPAEGMWFEFFVAVSVTSSDIHKVITKTVASEFILGAITVGTIATASAGGFSANGTNIVSVTMNATTDGGLLGGFFTLKALNTTQWMVEGTLIGSGTIETPFQTS
jgi:hypothetical protein